MIIKSIYGTFSIYSCDKDLDKLVVQSRDKASLSRIFDEKRIMKHPSEQQGYLVKPSKQEFVQTLILLVKEVDYLDFDQTLLDIQSGSDRVFV